MYIPGGIQGQIDIIECDLRNTDSLKAVVKQIIKTTIEVNIHKSLQYKKERR